MSAEFYKFIRKEHVVKKNDFWKNNPYDEVIIASGSIRKALILISQNFNNFSFVYIKNYKEIEITDPLELERYFAENVINGNGSLAKKTLLGYIHKVPCYAEPSNGETSSNINPYKEAVNKVMDLYKNKYKGKKVWIISTDTVDKPDAAEFPLGKPENEEDFPKRENYNKYGREANQEYVKAVEIYLQTVKNIYTLSQGIEHTNAIAIMDALSGLVMNLGELNTISLNIPIDHGKLTQVSANQDVGGGGMTQKLIEWNNPEQVKSYFGEFSRNLLKGKSHDVFKMALYCQIIGMPHGIIELLRIAHQELQGINDVAMLNISLEEITIYDAVNR